MWKLRLCFLSLLVLLGGCNDDKTTEPIPSDTTPPAAITDLSGRVRADRQMTLSWTAPGDDASQGRVDHYDLRYASTPLNEATWSTATVWSQVPVPLPAGDAQSVTVTGLTNGTWYFGLKAADEVPNWSPLSNVITLTLADEVAPSAVTNLLISYTTARSATLSWIAPGDDGTSGRATEYDLRYSLDTITAETWEAATRASGLPAPKDAGRSESFTVDGLENGSTYSFAIKAADEAGNWSGLSNVVSALVADYDPPSQVTDLAVWSTEPQRVTLRWTAPGNNSSVGRATEYDLRYSTAELSASNWEDAFHIEGVPAPDSAGSPQAFTVTGLQEQTRYYFGLKAADEAPNWSLLSNVVETVTNATPFIRLTVSRSFFGASYPAWSPDGRTIVLSADWDSPPQLPTMQLYSISADGGPTTRLTNDPEGADSPAWSPDGTHIAFISRREVYPYTLQELSLMDATPGATATVIATGVSGESGQESFSRPSWSPDGTRIVYTSSFVHYPDPTVSELRVVSPAGGSSTVLQSGWTMKDPSWSPDGSQIIFSGSRGGHSDIYAISPQGGDPTPLTTDPARDYSPVWSPDGSRIAFVSDRSGSADLWVMSSSGADQAPLTTIPDEYEYDPTWSPDGSHIAFVKSQTIPVDIWIMDVP